MTTLVQLRTAVRDASRHQPLDGEVGCGGRAAWWARAVTRSAARLSLPVVATFLWSSALLSPAHAQTISFVAPRDFRTGQSPSSVAVGDFNGDGKADLAVANEGSGTVSVLLGHGDGTFAALPDLAVGTNPFSVAVGDFNGDGKLDLAVTTAVAFGPVRDVIAILINNTPPSLSLSPTSVLGGPLGSSTGTVTLKGPAPSGGALVSLSSSDAAATVPASVTVPEGATSATFTVNTSPVIRSTTVRISASYNGTTRTANLTVRSAVPTL